MPPSMSLEAQRDESHHTLTGESQNLSVGDSPARHPWDVDHPYIRRVDGGWQQRSFEESDPAIDHRHYDEEQGKYTYQTGLDPHVRDHPVLYKLLVRTIYHPSDLKHRRRWLRRYFEEGEIVSDAQLARIPDPPVWPKTITTRWPELRRRRGLSDSAT